MKFLESMLAFYIVTCPTVYLELFTSWGFFSGISFLALFVLMRFFFGDAIAVVLKRAEKGNVFPTSKIARQILVHSFNKA